VICQLTDRIDAALLDAAAGCRIFANVAVGYNNVDVAAATARGIWISNTPEVLTDATADLAWTLILGVARRAAEGDRIMRSGGFPGWSMNYLLGGHVTGASLGLIGPGRIATAVAERAAGFRMRLFHHGPGPSDRLLELGSEGLELDELLARCDFVSVHVPLTEATRHLIDARALGMMKPTAYLINTSRGPVVDEAALVEALRGGQIGGAGLDVYEDEPRMATGLAECPNTMLLPHLGSATTATRQAMARLAAENVVAVLAGHEPPSAVNRPLGR
jgi:glyoxylate reductase